MHIAPESVKPIPASSIVLSPRNAEALRSGELEVWTADRTGANAVQVTSMRATPRVAGWTSDSLFEAGRRNQRPDAGRELSLK